jgi:hypothetical protein
MTDYSPLMDALDESGEPVTASDMMDAGYTDFEKNEVTPQMRVASILQALDGQIFDDLAKWHIVNELVALLEELDDEKGVESEIFVDGYEIAISYEPQGGVSR